MKTTTTLILAARVVAGLVLGSGSAMADGSEVISDYQSARTFASSQAQPGQSQSGASDVNWARDGGWQLGPFHSTPDRPNRAVGGGSGSAG
jgi:hypothetical protein